MLSCFWQENASSSHTDKDFKCLYWKCFYKLTENKWKKVPHANGSQKRAGVSAHILGKINFNSKTITRDKKSLYDYKSVRTLVICISIQNLSIQVYKQALTNLKEYADSKTIIVGDINLQYLFSMGNISRQKVSKETAG